MNIRSPCPLPYWQRTPLSLLRSWLIELCRTCQADHLFTSQFWQWPLPGEELMGRQSLKKHSSFCKASQHLVYQLPFHVFLPKCTSSKEKFLPYSACVFALKATRRKPCHCKPLHYCSSQQFSFPLLPSSFQCHGTVFSSGQYFYARESLTTHFIIHTFP